MLGLAGAGGVATGRVAVGRRGGGRWFGGKHTPTSYFPTSNLIIYSPSSFALQRSWHLLGRSTRRIVQPASNRLQTASVSQCHIRIIARRTVGKASLPPLHRFPPDAAWGCFFWNGPSRFPSRIESYHFHLQGLRVVPISGLHNISHDSFLFHIHIDHPVGFCLP